MAYPNIPSITPDFTLDRSDVINMIISAIAMDEIGLSTIIDTEGSRLQTALRLFLNGANRPDLVLAINEDVRQMLMAVIRNEQVMDQQLEMTLNAPVILGPTGPTGPTGPPGNLMHLHGSVGPAGQMGAVIDGITGPPGVRGLKGPQGPQGAPGSRGLMGLEGIFGPPGPLGPAGPSGVIGAVGPPGPRGAPGKPGLSGEKGLTGAPGASCHGLIYLTAMESRFVPPDEPFVWDRVEEISGPAIMCSAALGSVFVEPGTYIAAYSVTGKGQGVFSVALRVGQRLLMGSAVQTDTVIDKTIDNVDDIVFFLSKQLFFSVNVPSTVAIVCTSESPITTFVDQKWPSPAAFSLLKIF